MTPHSQKQLPLCCPCGSPQLYRRGLCSTCYERQRRDRDRFAGRRERVLTRDRRLCRVCHARDPLVVHHRSPRRKNSNRPAALITLCRGCHARPHRFGGRSTAGSPICSANCEPSSTPARRGSCSSLPHADARDGKPGRSHSRGFAGAARRAGPRRASQRALPARLPPALENFFLWYPSNAPGEGFTRATLQRYRSHLGERNLSAASINLHLAALRKLASEAAANELISPVAAAAISRVPGARRSGVRTGNWLTLEQARQLLAEPDPATRKGLRDRVLLGFLVGCGLRRGELAGLVFDDVAQREDRWAIVDLVGKHGRVGAGPLTLQAVFEAVVSYGARAGLGEITPHDLRRTFAKLAHLGRAPLEQIQISLGHASIQTTERYLGLRQNLHDAPCDRLGIRGWEG